jgi:DNA-damage-inducible protein D
LRFSISKLGISITENFEETKTASGGRDWKLSRFACYLTVMNADPKKRRVAEAQAYFITMAEAFRDYVQEAESVERVVIRGEVSEREKAISATVHSRGELRVLSKRRISWHV